MTVAISTNAKNVTDMQAFMAPAGENQEQGGNRDLMEEFSSLLEKIAMQVSALDPKVENIGVKGASKVVKPADKAPVKEDKVVQVVENKEEKEEEEVEAVQDEEVPAEKAEAEEIFIPEMIAEEVVDDEVEVREVPVETVEAEVEAEDNIVVVEELAAVNQELPKETIESEVVTQEVIEEPVVIAEEAAVEEVEVLAVEPEHTEIVIPEEASTETVQEDVVIPVQLEKEVVTEGEEKLILDHSKGKVEVEDEEPQVQSLLNETEQEVVMSVKEEEKADPKVVKEVVNQTLSVEPQEVENIKEDDLELTQLMESLHERMVSIKSDDASNLDAVKNEYQDMDVSAVYGQIWQSQYMPDVNTMTQRTLASSIEVSTQQAAQNTTVQNISLNLYSENQQFEKAEFGTRESKSLPRSQMTNMMNRVEKALKEVARSKDGKTISVRLDPEELGSIKVDVTLRDGKLHARLAADNALVTQTLRERAADLQQILRSSGIDVDEVSVSVGSEESDFDESMNRQTKENQESDDGIYEMIADDESLVENVTEDTTTVNSDDHWIA